MDFAFEKLLAAKKDAWRRYKELSIEMTAVIDAPDAYNPTTGKITRKTAKDMYRLEEQQNAIWDLLRDITIAWNKLQEETPDAEAQKMLDTFNAGLISEVEAELA